MELAKGEQIGRQTCAEHNVVAHRLARQPQTGRWDDRNTVSVSLLMTLSGERNVVAQSKRLRKLKRSYLRAYETLAKFTGSQYEHS
jgi:hypothetical protein